MPVGAPIPRGSYSLSGQLEGRESGSGTVPASTGLSYPLNIASLSGHRADLPRYVGDSLGELFTTSINSRSRLMLNQLNQFKTETAVKEAVLKILGERHESGRAQVGRPPVFERSPNPFNESYLSYDNITSHPYDNELEWYLGASSTPATRAPSPSPGDNLCYSIFFFHPHRNFLLLVPLLFVVTRLRMPIISVLFFTFLILITVLLA